MAGSHATEIEIVIYNLHDFFNRRRPLYMSNPMIQSTQNYCMISLFLLMMSVLNCMCLTSSAKLYQLHVPYQLCCYSTIYGSYHHISSSMIQISNFQVIAKESTVSKMICIAAAMKTPTLGVFQPRECVGLPAICCHRRTEDTTGFS